MILGIVSDIHCRADHLAWALGRMGSVDRLLCLGDAISQHRFSDDVVGMLRDHDALCVKGNHEQAYIDQADRRGEPISTASAWLRAWPDERTEQLGGLRLHMVHNAPWPGGGYTRVDDRRWDEALRGGELDVLLCGHTHQPGLRKIGPTLLLNPGSVGEGRPTDRGYVLSCATLDTITGTAQIIEGP